MDKSLVACFFDSRCTFWTAPGAP